MPIKVTEEAMRLANLAGVVREENKRGVAELFDINCGLHSGSPRLVESGLRV